VREWNGSRHRSTVGSFPMTKSMFCPVIGKGLFRSLSGRGSQIFLLQHRRIVLMWFRILFGRVRNGSIENHPHTQNMETQARAPAVHNSFFEPGFHAGF
jgi:hypothetical protein